MFNLFSENNKYSRFSFINQINNFEINPSDTFYSAAPNILKSDNWYKGISRVYIDAKGNLKKTEISKTEFYRNWLTLIKNDLSRGSSSKIFGELLESDPELCSKLLHLNIYENNDVDDFSFMETIQAVDKALIHVFGYTGYVCLLCGIMALRKTSTSITIEYINPNKIELGNLLATFNIRPLTNKVNIFADVVTYSINDMESMFTLFFLGFYHQCYSNQNNRMKMLKNVIEPPKNQGFIKDYFKFYNPRSPVQYFKTAEIFLSHEYAQFTDLNKISELHTEQRDLIFTKFEHILEGTITEIFLTQYFPSLDSLKQRTLKMASLVLMKNIFKPIDYEDGYDFVYNLMNLYQHYEDIYAIKLSSDDTRFRNKYLQAGIPLTISYNALDSLVSEAYFTSLFYAESPGNNAWSSHYNSRYFRLSFDEFWEANRVILGRKFKNTFAEYEDLFTCQKVMGRIKEKDTPDEIKITLYAENGEGIGNQNQLSELVEYKESYITFDPRNKEERYKAILSLIFYLYYEPRAFAIARIGRTFIAGMDITGLKSIDYITSSTCYKPITPRWYLWETPVELNEYQNRVRRFSNKNDFFEWIDTRDWRGFSGRIGDNRVIHDVMRAKLFPLFKIIFSKLKDNDNNPLFNNWRELELNDIFINLT